MPELPEVETIRRQLNENLRGRKILKVDVLRERSFGGDEKELVGQEIEKVERKAKVMVIKFHRFSKVVIVHLKMTGQLVFVDGEKRVAGGHPTADWVKELPSKHTRVVWTFADGSKLFFNDMRVFGWMRIVENAKWEQMEKAMPVDVIDRDFTSEYLKRVLERTTRAVKLAILDQAKIGGMGNIYANDALFLAGIKPTRKANEINDEDVVKLRDAMVEVINKGIKYGGASAADEKYVSASGLGGKYQDHFLVYERFGKNCLACGEKILKIKIGGRGTYYCPKCQS